MIHMINGSFCMHTNPLLILIFITGAKIERPFSHGLCNLRLQGRVCHRIGSLLPDPDEAPKFAQHTFMMVEVALQSLIAACAILVALLVMKTLCRNCKICCIPLIPMFASFVRLPVGTQPHLFTWCSKQWDAQTQQVSLTKYHGVSMQWCVSQMPNH